MGGNRLADMRGERCDRCIWLAVYTLLHPRLSGVYFAAMISASRCALWYSRCCPPKEITKKSKCVR